MKYNGADITGMYYNGTEITKAMYNGATVYEKATEPTEDSYVRITTTGATFSPNIELAAGSTSTVSWEHEGGDTYTGVNPTIDFGTAATRYVRMRVTNFDDVLTFNVGFNNANDAGTYYAGAAYNYTAQAISNIEYVNVMTKLKRFLAANIASLTAALDFTGMSDLQYIELYKSSVTSVNLTGCTSLIRICLEDNDVSTIDINPVAANLYDLRFSGNRSPFTIATLTSPMAKLYHYCAQSETVINHPTYQQLPVVEQLWDWSSGQTGAFVVRSTAIDSILSYNNGWTSVDLANQIPTGRNAYISLYDCDIASVDITGCSGINTLDLHGNALNVTAIDGILSTVNSWNTSNGTLNLSGNIAPTNTTVVDALTARGWTVTVDAPVEQVAPTISSSYNTTAVNTTTDVSIVYTISDGNGGTFSAAYTIDGTTTTANNLSTGSNTWAVGNLAEGEHTLTIQVTDSTSLTSNVLSFTITSTVVSSESTLFADEFDRANATGIANVGNGWTAYMGNSLADMNIDNGSAVYISAYYGKIANSCGGSLPANYTVETILPTGIKGTWYGLLCRYNPANDTGIRVLFPTATTIDVGAAPTYDAGPVTTFTPTFPTDWTNQTITHKIAVRMIGTRIEVLCDDVVVVDTTYSTNATMIGTSCGFCGDGGGGMGGLPRTRDYFKVYNVKTIVSDSFNRADSTTSLGVATSGQTWAAGSGVMGISGNQAYRVSGTTWVRAVVDAGISDCKVGVDIPTKSGTGSGHIWLRYVDVDNYLAVNIAATYTSMSKRVAGTTTEIQANASTVVNAGDRVEVICSGNTVQFAINGTLINSPVTVTDFATATKFGIGTYGSSTTTTFDNFTVEAL